jgi:hypothetical protein
MTFESDIAKKVGTDAAIILSNIEFWQATNKANNRNYFEDKHWTYNSIKAFSELFDYLTEKKIRTCLDKLENEGYIVSGNFNKSSYDRTKWYSSVKVKSICPNGQKELPEMSKGFAEKGETIPDNKPDNKPDTLLEKEIFYKDPKEFLSDWNIIRSKALKKPSNINRLARAEQPDFNELRSEYTRNEFRNGITALFKQDVINFDDMQMRPRHFLKFFEKYQTAFDEKSVGLYGRKAKESRL